MAEIEIKDGTGTGGKMKVDADKRAHIQSLSIPYDVFSVLAGDSFVVATPVIKLTSDSLSSLLYVENTNSHSLVLSAISVYLGESDSASKDVLLELFIAPTGGTIITAGTPTIAINNNLGSAKTLGVVTTIGGEGFTATGGIPVPIVQNTSSFFKFTQAVVVPPGTSFVMGVKPPAANSDMDVVVAFTLIKQTLDIT